MNQYIKDRTIWKGDCLEWQLSCDSNGYGVSRKLYKITGTRSVHRSSYILHKGDIPKGLLVRHTCHYRKCCNPDHLILGTHKDNTQDMIDAGRTNYARGTKINTNVLSEKQVLEIYKLKGKKTLKEIGLMYGVHLTTISYILNGKNWKHLYKTYTLGEKDEDDF